MFDKERTVEIAEAWVQLNRVAMDAREQDSLVEVLGEVDDIIQLGPAEGWMFIEAVRQMDLDASLLSNLAAGPLEDYLVAHGESEIARLEVIAKKDASFRELLGRTWRNAISGEVWQRVQVAAQSGPVAR